MPIVIQLKLVNVHGGDNGNANGAQPFVREFMGFRLNPRAKRGTSRRKNNFFRLFGFFSGPDFAKMSARAFAAPPSINKIRPKNRGNLVDGG